MKIVHASTSGKVPFVAVDSTDLVTRETGLTSFTVEYSLNGGTSVTMTGPTTTEIDSTDQPGVYWLDVDESGMTTLGSGAQFGVLQITVKKTGMAKAELVVDIERPSVTAGNTLDVTSTGAAGIDWNNIENPTTAVNLSGTNIDTDQVVASVSGAVGSVTGAVGSVTGAVGSVTGSVGSVVGHTAQTGDTYALANGSAGFVAIDTVVDAILVDTGTDIPASISGLGSAGGAAINTDAATDNSGGGITGVTSGTTIVGTPTNTYTDTSSVNGSYHTITHAADAIDIVYQFLIGGGTSPVSVTWTGYLTSGNDTITFSVWNHVGGAWEPMATQAGQQGTANVVKNIPLYARHEGTSAAELGKVYVRLHCTGQSSPVLNTDQIYVSYSVTSRSVGYANGAVWIDTVSGVAGTESFVNGVADNPVLTLADALTIATANNLRNFEVGNGSTITLAATTANKVFEGHEWTLDLNGQNIAESMFIDADVTGTSTGADAEFEDCIFGTSSMVAYQAYNCSYTGTQTFSAAGDYRFINCQSGVPGSSAPTFALGTGDISVEFRRWSGGMTLTGIGANDVITISGELGTVNLSGATEGTVEIRGTYKALTNASSGVTVNTTGAILGGDVATILADTNELQADWADGGRLDLILDARMPTTHIAATAGVVDQVTLVDTTTTNTDMVAEAPTAGQVATAVLTTQMTESYAANGVAPTLAEAQFAIHQALMQFGISGTALTVRKLDDATTAFVVTLDSSTAPTDAKRV